MPETIPNHIFKRAAQITDLFPDVPFMTLANIINADYLAEHSVRVVDPKEATEIRSTKKLEPLKRRGRPRRREITFSDGKTYAYPNQLDMLRMNGIQDVDAFPHNCPKDGDYCELEACKVDDIFTKAGLPIIKYVCYDFDCKKRAFVFPKESEAVNA